MEKHKQIQVTEEVWQALSYKKTQYKVKSFSLAIKALIIKEEEKQNEAEQIQA